MSDDKKPKPLDDLKEGLGLLFRAAKGAVENIPTDKIEGVAKDAAKQVEKTFDNIGTEMDKAWKKATASDAPPPPEGGQAAQGSAPQASADAKPNDPNADKKDEKKEEPYDDAYAPEPPKGPRIG